MVAIQDLNFNPGDSALAGVGQSLMYPQGTEEMPPLGYRMLDHLPSGQQVMGWNAWRASNTIMGATGNGVGGRLRNHMPGRLSKLSSYKNITGADGAYSPFNFLSEMGNRVVEGKAAKAAKVDPNSRWAKLAPGEGETHFSAGTYSRISTASRLNAGADATALKGAGEFIRDTNPELRRLIGNRAVSGNEAASYISASGRGTISNAVSGYVQGASRAGFHAEAHQTIAGSKSPAAKAASKAAMKAESHLALGGVKAGEKITAASFKVAAKGGAKAGAKFAAGAAARAASWAIPGVNIAMAAWTAVDIAKMGLEWARAVPGLTRDALNSFKGGIQKPVFGNRYVDNEVAATSRQRGVMAIQNSQLNMRNVLGSEASGMHSYFS